jgi:hypothetical protein
MKIGTQTQKKHAEFKIHYTGSVGQISRWPPPPFGNSSACYKIGNYHPILMKIGTQTQKNMLSLKITIPEVTIKFQDGRRRHIGN